MRPHAETSTQPVSVNHAMRPTQSSVSTDHSSANYTSEPGRNYRSEHAEVHTPSAIPPVSDNGELPPNVNQTIGFTMNGAPPDYNECMQLKFYDIGSLPAYNDSPPAYEDNAIS